MHVLYLRLVLAQVRSIHPAVQVLRLLLLDALSWRHSQRYPLRTFVRSVTSCRRFLIGLISNMFAQHFSVEFNRGILLKNVTEIQEKFAQFELRNCRCPLLSINSGTGLKGHTRCEVTWLRYDRSSTEVTDCHETRLHPVCRLSARFSPTRLASDVNQY